MVRTVNPVMTPILTNFFIIYPIPIFLKFSGGNVHLFEMTDHYFRLFP